MVTVWVLGFMIVGQLVLHHVVQVEHRALGALDLYTGPGERHGLAKGRASRCLKDILGESCRGLRGCAPHRAPQEPLVVVGWVEGADGSPSFHTLASRCFTRAPEAPDLTSLDLLSPAEAQRKQSST